jgi:hypothetical protein
MASKEIVFRTTIEPGKHKDLLDTLDVRLLNLTEAALLGRLLLAVDHIQVLSRP